MRSEGGGAPQSSYARWEGAGCTQRETSLAWEWYLCRHSHAQGAAELDSVLITPLRLVLELIHVPCGGN